MTTAYAVTDTAPKEAGGQKFLVWTDVHASQADFALTRGIGTSQIGGQSFNSAHLAVGMATQGSAIETKYPIMLEGGVHIENVGASAGASKTSSGSAQIVAVSNWNELHTRGAYLNPSQLSTSANLIQNGSGIVYSMHVALSEVALGDVFRLRDGSNDVFTVIAGSAFGNVEVAVPEGGIAFTSTIAHAQTVSTGAASVTIAFR